MRLAPVVAIVCFLVLLLTWLSLRAINPEAELFDQALAEIDHFATMENALYRDIFTARAGTSRNYDPLVAEIVSLRSSLDRLRKTAVIDAETAEAVDRLAASVDRQEDLVERFKSDNALLHNSLSFFGRFSVRPVSSELGPAISSAAAAMLHLTLDTSPAAAGEVEDRLNELAKQAQASDSDSIIPLLAHGRLLHDLLPAVDNTLKAMRAVPRKSDQDALRSLVLARQLASRTTARQFRRVLYATSLLLVGFLVHLGLRLRARARALQRRAALEHVIAGISMRFINAPIAKYRYGDRTGACRYGTAYRLGPSLFRAVGCRTAVVRLEQNGEGLSAGLAGGGAGSCGPVRSGRRWNYPDSRRRLAADGRKQKRMPRVGAGGVGVRDQCQPGRWQLRPRF
jgi:hypothetical protein